MIESIESLLKDVFVKLGYNTSYAKVSYSNKPLVSDFQINSVFSLTKELGLSPEVIAKSIIDELSKNGEYFESLEFAFPGFINIKVSESFINKFLNNPVKIKQSNTYFLDYGGPNIAKSLHVGHLRPAIIGESLKRIIAYAGNKVISDVHLGDYGLQIGQVIYGLKKENIDLNEIDIKVLERIYPMISKICKEDEEILGICQTITADLQNGNEEYKKYWTKIYKVSLDDIKRIYNYLGVSFDLWLGESDTYKIIPEVMKYLESKNVIKLDEGAKIIEVKKDTDEKEMPPLIIEKSNGAYLYATTDLATIYERVNEYNPDYILYVVDDRQRIHFEQLFRACELSGLNKNSKLEHNYFGTINGIDGKPLKTRSGDLLRLDELINEARLSFLSKKEDNKDMLESDIDKIVNSIIKFADLQNNREKSYIFDMNKFSDTVGKTGPYILYTAIRIRKILNDNSYQENLINMNSKNDEERNLKLKLIEVNNSVTKAINERMPHYIADYVYELSTIINSFYQKNNISNEINIEVKNNWLNLLRLSYNTLESMLKLLIIEIPSKM